MPIKVCYLKAAPAFSTLWYHRGLVDFSIFRSEGKVNPSKTVFFCYHNKVFNICIIFGVAPQLQYLKPEDVICQCPEGYHFFDYYHSEYVGKQIVEFWQYANSRLL